MNKVHTHKRFAGLWTWVVEVAIPLVTAMYVQIPPQTAQEKKNIFKWKSVQTHLMQNGG